MANWTWNNLFQQLDQWGFIDVLLPFLLVFTIIFAILQKTKILGEDKRNFNTVLSLVIALLTVIPHVTGNYPSGYDIVEIINTSLPGVSLIAVAVVMLLLLIGLFGGEAKWMGGSLSGWIAIASFVIIIGIFGGSAGWWGDWTWFTDFFGEGAVALIIIILVFGIIIAFITGGEGGKAASDKTKLLDSIGNYFKGGK